MALYLGLDFGTSGCRAVVIDQNDKIQTLLEQSFPDPLRDGSRVEQDPQIWWQVLQTVLQQLSKQIDCKQIKAIAVDGTSASVFLIDQYGSPQTSALMYNDARSDKQALHISQIAKTNGKDAGAAAAATSSLAKLCWWLENKPNARACKISHQSDWIAGRLCQRYAISDTNNCLKLGFNASQKTWPDWFADLHIPTDMLPEVFQPGEPMAIIDASIADEFGFSYSTQIVAGTTDSTAAVIATGVTEIGDAVTTLGTTLVQKILSTTEYSSSKFGVYSQPLFDQWLVGGASNSGGAILKHYFSDQQIQSFSEQIDPTTDTGLDYYPLLHPGERFPINDTQYAPKLSPRPDSDLLFFQAILEGIANIEKKGYDRLSSLGAPYPNRIITMGGGAKNIAWGKMRQRILGVPVSAAVVSDSAYGVAKLAKSCNS